MTADRDRVVAVQYPSEGIARIVIARGQRLNPISFAVIEALLLAVDEVVREKVGVAILCSGEDNFSAGADLKEQKTLSAQDWAWYIEREYELFARLAAAPLLFVAYLKGYCYGNAAEIALACDLRFASRDLRLAWPELRAGATGPAGQLARYVPLGLAQELLYTGRDVTADEAAAWHLVRLVEDEAAAVEHCRQLVALPRTSLNETKRRIRIAYGMGGQK